MKIHTIAFAVLGAAAVSLGAANYMQYRAHERMACELLQQEHRHSLALQTQKELRAEITRLQARDPQPTGMDQRHLRGIIRATLEYVGVQDTHDWERLLLLTVVTESNLGTWTRQLRGPARGIVQIEPRTERCVLDWMKTCRPELYAKVKSLRVPARLNIHEAEYNTSYALALCYGVYIMRKAQPKGKPPIALAQIYKDKYNTKAGKATVAGVMGKLSKFGVKI